MRKCDRLSSKVENGFLDLVAQVIDMKCHEEFGKELIKGSTEGTLKMIFIEMLTLIDPKRCRGPVHDSTLSQLQLNSLGIHRFILKHIEVDVATRRIDAFLIQRRAHKLNPSPDSLPFASFFALFVGASKTPLVTQSTPVRPSRCWTGRPKSKINFNQQPALEIKSMSQKKGTTRAEELRAFSKRW